MKRIITLTAALFISAAMFAQAGDNAPKEVKAWSGRAYAVHQESYTPSFDIDGKNTKVRNVILMIGDGMGMGAVNAAMYANGGTLTMTNLRTFGLVRTQSADNFTTDSAASGTAYAAGEKTNNGYVGMNTKQEKIANLPEKLAPLGYACGVVSTDDLNGATPASFFAHQSARGSTAAIWANLTDCYLSFASAGTRKVYETLELKTRTEIEKQFKVVYDPAQAGDAKRLIYLPESVNADRGDYLPRTTKMAIDFLSSCSKKGFFLMVEGARIDKEEHRNDYNGVVRETLDFDKAIEESIRFAEKDGHTLVIISADHETGGTVLNFGVPSEGMVMGTFTSRGHSPMMVPLFAYGPKSGMFMGTQENSDVSNKIYTVLSGKK